MILRVGGVPEHFNFPWHLADKYGLLSQAGLRLDWRDYPGGTGAMLRDLKRDELQLAVLLSEGAVAGISAGHDLRLLTFTVATPLRWGVHVPPGSPRNGLADLARGAPLRVAISRRLSGSHLMSHVLADQLKLKRLEFVEVGSLVGAAEAFAADRADVFLWERFTTQPTVDRGQMKRIGECPTPWPPFCLVTSGTTLAHHPAAVARLCQIWFRGVSLALRLPDLPQRIGQHYGLAESEVIEWLRCTRWADRPTMADRDLKTVIAELRKLSLVDQHLTPRQCRVS
ncbi:MAG: ABC transporter substrate-binding protein [Pseudomonadota bacterium]